MKGKGAAGSDRDVSWKQICSRLRLWPLTWLVVSVLLGACQTSLPASNTAAPTPTASPAASATRPDPATATATAEPSSPPRPTAVPTATQLPAGYVLYTTRSGDILGALAGRFGVSISEISCASSPDRASCPLDGELHPEGMLLLPEGVTLIIPDLSGDSGPPELLLPDSEVIFSQAAAKFDVSAYVEAAGGFLATHNQYLMLNGWNTASGIVTMVAEENSINPRLLLGLLEYQCGCLLNNPGPLESIEPFLGATSQQYLRSDLYGQLDWAVNRLSTGYYGWRHGTLTEVVLKDGNRVRLDPRLNAGTAALQYTFAQLFGREEWLLALDPEQGFPATFSELFGDPWERAERIFPADISQPPMQLPFVPGKVWALTGGPHAAFEGNGPLAALDFAPAAAGEGCLPAETWVAAAADGLVVRSEFGLIIQDLDGDGLEQTGWNIMYLHLAEQDRVPQGTYLETGDRVGTPSCEGGVASGTHLHIARKYNGEWIPAESALPFNLSGWIAHNGAEPYLGTLTRGEESREACVCSWQRSWLQLDE